MKDYTLWHQVKSSLHNSPPTTLIHLRPREVRWMSIGSNIGVEQDGKGPGYTRPVLILRVFGALSFLGVPLSSKVKLDNRYYLPVQLNEKTVSVVLSQMRLFSTLRISQNHSLLGVICHEEFDQVREAIRLLL